MGKLQNLHTHTTYCDGKDTPREMVEAALQMGFNSIGFSGHSYMHYSPSHSMSLEGTEEYIREIRALKEEYADRIKIYCGIEFDMYSMQVNLKDYEYAIGSVHYLLMDGKYVGFDRSQSEVEQVIHTYFQDDGMAYAEKYYETLATLPEYGDFDILGHFDLISKHCENIKFYDEQSPRYRNAAVQAMEALSGKIPYFEVNTVAIARGYRKTPYPSIPLIKELKRLGFEPVITSDCHDASYLSCEFEQAEKILKECGFRYRFVLTDEGFCPVKL